MTMVIDLSLQWCVRQGGNWCYMHEDHLINKCVEALGVRMQKLEGMQMVCPVGTAKLHPPSVWENDANVKSFLKNTMLTCHYVDKETSLAIFSLLS